MRNNLEIQSRQIWSWFKHSIFHLSLITAVICQDSLMVRGYIHDVDASICMDNCSWFYLEPDPGFESLNLTMLPDPAELALFTGMHVELWGYMETCVMCEALDVTEVIILDEVPPTVVEGTLTGPNVFSFCMDGCDEYTLEMGENMTGDTDLIESSITECHAESTPSFISTVIENNVTLHWSNALLNCCVEPNWAIEVDADNIVQFSFIDTGFPCDCECNFDLTATFGPFEPGTYSGHFNYGWDSYTFNFTINFTPQEFVFVTTLGNPESLQPYVDHYVQITGYETWCVECGGIVPDEIIILDEEVCTMDINGDGDVNVIDIIQIVNCVLILNGCDNCMDINEDGNLNVLDIVELVMYILLDPPELNEQCYEIPEMGPCEAWIPVWFYNHETEACEQTNYGGCEGNVAFWTEAECVELCE